MDTQTVSMESYLAETALCDWHNQQIQAKTAEVTASAESSKAKALAIFYFVRDNIQFSLAFSRSKASQIWQKGYGECGTKTNLQVAMLRAAGIPARYRWVEAKSAALNHLVADFVYKNMPPTASHFWCECFIDDKWLSCEALLDKPLYEGMLKAKILTKDEIPTIDWDGESELVLLRPWIVKERGTLPSYDDALERLQASEEGMPPLWLERLVAPFFYPYNKRVSDKLRKITKTH